MKKSIVFLSFVLATSIIFGQDMLLKKQTVVLESGYEIYVHYKYNTDWELDSIIQVSQSGDTGILKLFADERIMQEIQPNYSATYTYYEDSASSFTHWNDNTQVYFFNENNEVYLQKNYGPTGDNWGNSASTWENGNCTITHYTTGQLENMDYDENYLNPFENENKFLKRSFHGSKNFLTHGEFISYTYDQTVLNSLNGYPTEVDFTDGNENRNFFFEYYNFTGIDNWEFEEDASINNILYFNILGQQINKPAKGLFIEHTITERGVVSKKYFIP